MTTALTRSHTITVAGQIRAQTVIGVIARDELELTFATENDTPTTMRVPTGDAFAKAMCEWLVGIN